MVVSAWWQPADQRDVQPGRGVGHRQADGVHRDDREKSGDHPGGDQVRHAGHGHRLQRVDLLGDPHRAQLGGVARAERADQRYRGDQRSDVAGVEVGDEQSGQRLRAHRVQRPEALQAHEAADEQRQRGHHAGSAEDDDQSARAETDLGQQPGDLLAVAPQGPRHPADRPAVKRQLVAEVIELVQRSLRGPPQPVA